MAVSGREVTIRCGVYHTDCDYVGEREECKASVFQLREKGCFSRFING
jgi:hypothetical protein